MPVVAPSSVLPDRKEEYYKSEEEWLTAITDAMRVEYKMIVDAGFVLQIDDARFATAYDRMVPPGTFEDFVRFTIPELQKRGLYRKEYTGATLRENLGLPKPGMGSWKLPVAA